PVTSSDLKLSEYQGSLDQRIRRWAGSRYSPSLERLPSTLFYASSELGLAAPAEDPSAFTSKRSPRARSPQSRPPAACVLRSRFDVLGRISYVALDLPGSVSRAVVVGCCPRR